MELTILQSKDFWDELIKRSPEAEDILLNQGRTRVGFLLMAAFELKQEYDERMAEHDRTTNA